MVHATTLAKPTTPQGTDQTRTVASYPHPHHNELIVGKEIKYIYVFDFLLAGSAGSLRCILLDFLAIQEHSTGDSESAKPAFLNQIEYRLR